MTKEELLRIVQTRGYDAKIQGEEVLVKDCISCGNPRFNMELNASKGVYHSWCCRKSGSLEKLLREHFGQDQRIPVDVESGDSRQNGTKTVVTFGSAFQSAKRNIDAVEWLHNRGISKFDIDRYNIQLCVDEDHDFYGRVVIPLKDYWSGEFIGYTGRKFSGMRGAKYLHEIKTKTSVGYRRNSELHICVEGIFDGIRVHQAGFNAHTLLGSGSNDRFVEWAATLPKDQIVLLLLDGDEVGQKRSEALKHLTATVREEPMVLSLPPELDPADLKKDVLRQFIEKRINNE